MSHYIQQIPKQQLTKAPYVKPTTSSQQSTQSSIIVQQQQQQHLQINKVQIDNVCNLQDSQEFLSQHQAKLEKIQNKIQLYQVAKQNFEIFFTISKQLNQNQNQNQKSQIGGGIATSQGNQQKQQQLLQNSQLYQTILVKKNEKNILKDQLQNYKNQFLKLTQSIEKGNENNKEEGQQKQAEISMDFQEKIQLEKEQIAKLQSLFIPKNQEIVQFEEKLQETNNAYKQKLLQTIQNQIKVIQDYKSQTLELKNKLSQNEEENYKINEEIDVLDKEIKKCEKKMQKYQQKKHTLKKNLQSINHKLVDLYKNQQEKNNQLQQQANINNNIENQEQTQLQMIKPDYECLEISEQARLTSMVDNLMKVVTMMQDNYNTNIAFIQHLKQNEQQASATTNNQFIKQTNINYNYFYAKSNENESNNNQNNSTQNNQQQQQSPAQEEEEKVHQNENEGQNENIQQIEFIQENQEEEFIENNKKQGKKRVEQQKKKGKQADFQLKQDQIQITDTTKSTERNVFSNQDVIYNSSLQQKIMNEKNMMSINNSQIFAISPLKYNNNLYSSQLSNYYPMGGDNFKIYFQKYQFQNKQNLETIKEREKSNSSNYISHFYYIPSQLVVYWNHVVNNNQQSTHSNHAQQQF